MDKEKVKDFIDSIAEDLMRKAVAFYCRRCRGMIRCDSWVKANGKTYDIVIKRREKHS